MTMHFKHPVGSYPPRFKRFLRLLSQVKRLPPANLHLWKVMDTVAFQDTETALETTLFDAKLKESRRKAENE